MTDQTSDATPAVATAKHTVTVPNSINMVSLLGPGDEHLELIETAFEADVHVRGNRVTLEGPPAEIDALLDDIIADERHHHLRVILTETTVDRSFPDWRMGFGTPGAHEPAGLPDERDSFNDLAAGADGGTVRRAADDVSTWFKAKEHSAAS